MSIRARLPFRTPRLKFLLFTAALFAVLLCFAPHATWAQATGGSVRGRVADPDDAVIPGAIITLTPAKGKPLTTTSQGDGSYLIVNVPPGTYTVTAGEKGFASFQQAGVVVSLTAPTRLNIKLAIQTEEETVTVTTTATQLSTDPDSNSSQIVLKGKDLDALSDDPDELQNELTALAGPSAGPNGGQIYVDGFTGGQLPPKSSIREIRINQNPFSAQYDRLGFGRVEIFTKPGTDSLHGQINVVGNDKAFNTINPIPNENSGATVTQPPYHTIYFQGNISGPLTKTSSYNFSLNQRNIQDNGIIADASIYSNPATPTVLCNPGDPTCTSSTFNAAISQPQTRTDLSSRIDLQMGAHNTVTVRYQFNNNSATNAGVGNLTFATRASNTTSQENTIQVSDTQSLLGDRLVNETRFEFQRDNSTSTPQNSSVALSVPGAFNGGGTGSGPSSSYQNHYELQNYTSLAAGKNFVRLGGRLRVNSSNVVNTAGANGISLSFDCVTAVVNGNACPTSAGQTAPSTYASGKVSTFSYTNIVNPSVQATVADLGVYAEDDWKALPNLTISYGGRYETQSAINDHHDFAPRVAIAYGVGHGKTPPKTVLRAGYGFFYDRFGVGNVLTTAQENGVNQLGYSARYPTTTTCSYNNLSGCMASASAQTPGTYSIDPGLKASLTMIFGGTLEQSMSKYATLTMTYINARGVHQDFSSNVAYPHTGTPAAGTTLPNTDVYISEGIFKQAQLITQVNLHGYKNISLSSYYVLNSVKGDTSGTGSFPTQPYHITNDYGRTGYDVRQRLFLFGSVPLPSHIQLSPLLQVSSGNPYNVTLGTDLYGDNIANDRPEFATSSSTNVKSNNCGSFDLNTTLGETPIPINYCTGPASFVFNLRIAKAFGFGPQTGARARRNGGQGGQGGPPPAVGGGGPGGGGGGGGRGGGGGGAPGGGGGGMSTGRKYSLTFAAQTFNLFNVVNRANPQATLTSPKFGQYQQLSSAGTFGGGGSSDSVRRILINATFTF